MPRKKCPCGRWKIYGLQGDTRPSWCRTCRDKPSEAIDVVSKKCKCGKGYPIYGFLSDTRPIWCRKCKPDEAVNVRDRKCPCGKHPIFGLPGEKATWCGKCKPDDAIDVKNKKCPCGKGYPIYGLLSDTRPIWCGKCRDKPLEAVNVASKKCPCGKSYPFYGLPGDKPLWCPKCPNKPNDAVNVVNSICPGYDGVPCPVRTQLATGKAYCLSCDPDESRRLPRKKDEHAFFVYLEKNNVQVTQREYRIDYKCVDTSKSHAFIDGVIITPDIVLCLEVDEDAHRNYECDEARTNFASTELLLAFPDHHIAWVRVNPTVGNFDRSDNALKIRDERYSQAVSSIRELLVNPRTDIIYIGYDE
ncbi:hypothetical protein PBCVAN69C_146R [Paramecium bursaria Chlorella virus AN69C]|uniref:Uncharacterized protein n=1 Tax=Paramecium bursaria Chlorella virus 1 TaxID=10506 RepID=Q84449_PBCV1|nr:hypothetical protein PBCV1_A129R [Paramecium bursaria Chlorella virus 1]AAC96497.1 hypothetical protein [Paramecium bursaria Chlorella virus 1]AGE48368.1 hypothetical protein PBCVAN69C_146R [Paramecium bursaria Chlorella virus AN69C]